MEKNNSQNDFIHFINSLPIDKQLKEDMTDPSMLRGHVLYANLVHYLLPLYPGIKIEEARKLSLSGYLYFRFLLLIDSYIDTTTAVEKNADNRALLKLAVAFEFHEESIKGLSQLLGNNNKFWTYFQKVKNQYYHTVLLEKTLSKTRPPFTEETFLSLAAGKSAICNATIYALESLGQTDIHTNVLLECLRHIHIGLQYQDDIDDFKKDINEQQWTYPQHLVHVYIRENNITLSDTTQLHKYLYISGIASSLMDKAVYHLEKSIEITKSLQLAELSTLLEKRKSIFTTYQHEISLLLEKTVMKMQKENLFIENQTIPTAIEQGVAYLTANMNENKGWSDFLTSAGFGRSWITAYIGLQLAEHEFCGNILKAALDELNNRAANAFNDEMIIDGDSTTFMIGFQKKIKNSVQDEQWREWLTFMNQDGGCVTYRMCDGRSLIDKLQLEGISVDGWTTDKFCVTAAAAYVLSFVGESEVIYDKSCEYLINNVSPNGSWSSYWWTSDIYATSFSIMALSARIKFRHHAEKAVTWLVKRQRADGYWVSDIDNSPASPFYTALSLKALMLFDHEANRKNILKGVTWLLRNQITDGSWMSSKSLRIPATDIDDPKKIKNWRVSSFGVNCVVDDHNRVFTTATVVNTLALFSKLFTSDIDLIFQYEADTEKPLNRVGDYT